MSSGETTVHSSDEDNLPDIDSSNKKSLESKQSCVDVLNVNNVGKELYLIKLPSELIKYQKKHNDLSLNIKSLKAGSRFTVQNVEYEATLSKTKSAFSCLCQNEGSLKAVNNFKYIIHVKQVFDVPKPTAPEIVIKNVEVPQTVDYYLTKKNKKLKRLLKKQAKIK